VVVDVFDTLTNPQPLPPAPPPLCCCRGDTAEFYGRGGRYAQWGCMLVGVTSAASVLFESTGCALGSGVQH